MSVEQWRPLSWRFGTVPGGWRAPVPAALERRLREWVDGALRGNAWVTGAAVWGIAERVLLRLDLVPPADRDGNGDDSDAAAVAVRFLAYGVSVDVLPDVVDAVLFLLPGGVARAAVAPGPATKPSAAGALATAMSLSVVAWADERRKTLAMLLDDALSVFRLRRDGRGLERRADPDAEAAFGEVVKAAEGASASGSAAVHLRAAWTAVYSLHPDPGKGYSEAIKAVEAAAHAVVEPNNRKATLGTMLGHLRANRKLFSLVIVGRDGRGDIGPLIECIALLWDGQSSRHGSSAPTRVESPEEAVMALHLAVMLVQWFVSGAVRRSALRACDLLFSSSRTRTIRALGVFSVLSGCPEMDEVS